MKVSIRTTIDEQRKGLAKLAKQLPFAMSKALNAQAFEVRTKGFVAEFKRRFKLRNKFLTKGIRKGAKGPGGVGVQESTKKELHALVFTGSQLEHTDRHETGGILKKFGRHRKTVPTDKVKRNARGIIGRAARIAAIRRKENSNLVPNRAGGRPRGGKRSKRRHFLIGDQLFRREAKLVAGKRPTVGRTKTGRATRRKPKRVQSRRVFLTYKLVDAVKLKDSLDIVGRSHAIVKKNFTKHFDKELDRALRTAR